MLSDGSKSIHTVIPSFMGERDVCGVGGGAVGTAGERGESGGGGAVVSLHSKMSVG